MDLGVGGAGRKLVRERSLEMERYGYEWAEGTNELSIELACYARGEDGGAEKEGHLRRAMQRLWVDGLAGRGRVYVWNEWTDARVRAWCCDEFREGDRLFQTLWGPGSSGKSCDIGILALTDWLSSPERTTTVVVSTTKDMLERRIWGEMLKFYGMYGGRLPGYYSRSKNAILLGDENTKNGIFGIAIQKGTVSEAMGSIVGMHNERNVLIVDEMQATREAVMDAQDNLSSGRYFRFVGMGNPESRVDPLGKYSEPIEGWGALDMGKEAWETRFGKTHFYDGRKSPGVRDPEKYPFLLGQKSIDDLASKRGVDSPAFWSQRIGFMPPEGIAHGMMTESFVVRFSAMDAARWADEPEIVLGVDPAFSEGGDECVVSPARVGRMETGTMGIEFLPVRKIHLKLSQGAPVVYYLSEQIRAVMEELKVSVRNVAMDCTGAQRILADVVEREVKEQGLFRVDFAGSASDEPVSDKDPRHGKDAYHNRVTELWFRLMEYTRHGMIRGLDGESVKQLTMRRLIEKDLKRVWLEPKKVMKFRTGHSPDNADSKVIVTALVLERMGIRPGSTGARNVDSVGWQREADIDSGDTYLGDAVESVAEVLA